MKKLILGLACLVPLNSWAFVGADDNLIRKSLNVLIESYDNQADITVTHILQNPTDEAINFSYFLPTTNLAVIPEFSWQSDILPLTNLNRREAADEVFELAKQYDNTAWLGSLDVNFHNWFKTPTLSLPAGETGILKYKLNSPLAFFENFYQGQVWLADNRLSENFTINLVRAGQTNFLWSPMGTWTQEKTSEAWAKQWTAENISLKENFTFFTSETADPFLRFNYLDQSYEAQFKTLNQNEVKRVVIALDKSGSVYGVRYERLKEALRTMLETMPESTEMKFGLVAGDVEWLSDEWLLNNRENQQNILALADGAQVQGKTDWETAVSALNLVQNSSDNRYALIWLGDFSDVPQNLLTRLANAGWKTLMLDFWQTQSATLDAWWARYNSQYVPLFNSGFELVEADNLTRAWRALNLSWPIDNSLALNASNNLRPKTLQQFDNQASLKQSGFIESNSAFAEFVPRWWAARKVADYLRQHEGLPLKDFQQQAVLSIANAFGIKVFALDGRATPESLASALSGISTNALWDEILKLEAGVPQTENIIHWQAKPFYLQAGVWKTYDWDTYVARPNRPELERWSSAHKNLFTSRSELLAKPLSLGAQVSFCAGNRCASVLNEGRAEIQRTDILLWENLLTPHWANDYWTELVWEDVLSEESYDLESWSEPVSRGQFLVWLQRYLEPNAEMPLISSTLFSDLDSEQLGAAQAMWFNQKDLFRGYSGGTARLNDPLKRIEGLKILMQSYGLDTRDVLGNFDDKMPFSDLLGWTQPWGYEAYLRGLVNGYEDQTFRPFQDLTKAEAFKLILEAKRKLLNTEPS